MPRKKLTKAQVKRKFKSINNLVYDLIVDRLGHNVGTHVPMSAVKLLEMQKAFGLAAKRIK